MELLLLLVILPAVQDQNHTREWLKNATRAWCSVAAWLLNLRSYLFGDTPEDTIDQPAGQPQQQPQPQAQPEVEPEVDQPANVGQAQAQEGLAAAHQALLQREGPIGFQPYKRPKMFPLLVSFI